MNLYETNFTLLRGLIPDIDALPMATVSRVASGQDLYLQIEEVNKYTSRITLTHCFCEHGEAVVAPALTICIYFDAQQAEVLTWQGTEDFAGIKAESFSQLPSVEAKYQVNLFLGKWLQYCVGLGHQFGEHVHSGLLLPQQPAIELL